MSDIPTFQESRRRAYGLLGDAADEIRAGDWKPAPTARQRTAIRQALNLIGQAKAALDEAGRDEHRARDKNSEDHHA